MGQPVIQTSFNSGEWAPALNARVDLQKYHSGAALIRNFFVDYRGGATTRPGSRYVATGLGTSFGSIRLIPFQASFTVSYMLEFGQLTSTTGYVRFYNNGAPVLEPATTISGVTNASPGVITDTAHGYTNAQWIFISGVVGMTQLNGNYYLVANATANTYTLTDLFGNAVDTTGFGAYISGGTAQRVYTIVSPYLASELAQLKFAQNVNTLTLCHPNHPPYVLTLVTATNWTLAAISFGATVATPTGLATATTLAGGSVNYAYIVTAVDINGQESAVSAFAVIASVQDIRSVAGSNTVTWSAVTGAISYNIYRAQPVYSAAVPAGAQFGFIGNVTGTTFVDSNAVNPNYAQGPPITQNPFAGSGVQNVTVTAAGTYATTPGVTFGASPTGDTAHGVAVLGVTAYGINTTGGGPSGAYAIGDNITFQGGAIFKVTSIIPGGGVANLSLTYPGAISGTVPANPVSQTSTNGSGNGCTLNLTWGVTQVQLTSPGSGYVGAPAVSFSSGAAAANATLGAASAGNPTVPQFYDQRLVFAGPIRSPNQFNMSQPGSYYNYNITEPVEADNAIQGTLVAGQLQTIQAMLPMSNGLIMLSSNGAWLINGGSPGAAPSALSVAANSQAYNGCGTLPPIVANFDILYVQSKGSIVRDLTFNFYTQIYTGTDISVLSSHLFYGFQLREWAFAEEPFKLVWAVRSDGNLLSLAYLKEQELIAWSHHDTQGTFQSIAAVTESTVVGNVDAVYVVVKRSINGTVVQYIERLTEVYYPNGVSDAFNVDAGISYSGAAATTFSGAQHLAGATVTGVADGVVIPPFAMPTSGTFVLGTAASKVTVGLSYLPQLQTLALDLGEPTVQGKMKQITAVTLRCKDALGLQIGSTFATCVDMQDLVIGNVGSMTNQLVTNLVTGDARTIIDAAYTVPGQYCIQQTRPWPASVLGVIPQIEVGDTQK